MDSKPFGREGGGLCKNGQDPEKYGDCEKRNLIKNGLQCGFFPVPVIHKQECKRQYNRLAFA